MGCEWAADRPTVTIGFRVCLFAGFEARWQIRRLSLQDRQADRLG